MKFTDKLLLFSSGALIASCITAFTKQNHRALHNLYQDYHDLHRGDWFPLSYRKARQEKWPHGKWGSASWYIDAHDDMYIDSGSLKGTLYQTIGQYAHKIRTINFVGFVQAPQDSSWLLSTSQDINDFSGQLYAINGLERMDVSQVTRMRQMFYGNQALKELNLSHWDVGQVIDMYEMFGNDHALKSLQVDDWDTSHVRDLRLIFYNATSLVHIDMSQWDLNRAADTEHLFAM